MIWRSNFGPVRVTGGRYKGRVGYFDDYDDESRKAIVFFAMPIWKHRAHLIPLKQLETVTVFKHAGETYIR